MASLDNEPELTTQGGESDVEEDLPDSQLTINRGCQWRVAEKEEVISFKLQVRLDRYLFSYKGFKHGTSNSKTSHMALIADESGERRYYIHTTLAPSALPIFSQAQFRSTDCPTTNICEDF